MGQMGGCCYPIGQGHGIYNNQPYVNQPYQGAWNQMSKPRLPFLAMLNLPNLSRLTNDLVSHDPTWPVILTKLPSDILKFEGNTSEDPGEQSQCYTFGALQIP